MSGLPTTRWSLVLSARDDAESGRQALAALCAAYRTPVLAYLRRRVGDAERAADLVQGFFVHFLDQQLHHSADPDRGRFRSFLLTCVRHYLGHEIEREQALRRGGAMQHVDTEAVEVETEADGPEAAFERAWAATVIARASARLEAEAVAAGKSGLYAELRGFLVDAPDASDYAGLAERLGMRRNTLAVAVYRMRQRLQQLVREELAETVSAAEDVELELAVMRKAMRPRSGP